MDTILQEYGIHKLNKRVDAILQTNEPLTEGEKNEISTYCDCMKMLCLGLMEKQSSGPKIPPLSIIMELAEGILKTGGNDGNADDDEDEDETTASPSEQAAAAAESATAQEPEQHRQQA